MKKSEQKRFDELYRKHLRALKLQGMSGKTIDAYSRSLRLLSAWSDCCPDPLEPAKLAVYFPNWSSRIPGHRQSRALRKAAGSCFMHCKLNA